MKYFIGVKDSQGRVVVADFIEADHFREALKEAERIGEADLGRGNFRVTAVNEQPSEEPSHKGHEGAPR